MWSAPNADDEFAHVASLWAVPTTFDDDAEAPSTSGQAVTPTSGPADATPFGTFTVTEGFATPGRHAADNTTPPPQTNAAPIVSPTNGGRAKLCKFHANGGCVKGAECPFSHDLSIRASTTAAAKAGFVFVTGVANIVGAQNVESAEGGGAEAGCSTPTGLNPSARAFAPGSDSDTENNGYTGRHHYGGEGAEVPSQTYFGASEHLVGHQHEQDGGFGGQVPYRSGYTSNAATPPTYTQRRRVPITMNASARAEEPLDFASRQQQALRPPLEISHSGANKVGVSPKPTERPRPPTGVSMMPAAHHRPQGSAAYDGGYHNDGLQDHDAGYAGDEASMHGYYGGNGGEGYHHHHHHRRQQPERFVPWQGFH